MWVRSLVWEDSLEEGRATHSSILTRKSHGQRSLAGYSPWGRRESDATACTCVCIYTHAQTYHIYLARRNNWW